MTQDQQRATQTAKEDMRGISGGAGAADGSESMAEAHLGMKVRGVGGISCVGGGCVQFTLASAQAAHIA